MSPCIDLHAARRARLALAFTRCRWRVAAPGAAWALLLNALFFAQLALSSVRGLDPESRTYLADARAFDVFISIAAALFAAGVLAWWKGGRRG